jgi:hypothetical protein
VGLSKLSASSRGVKSERRCSLVNTRSICTNRQLSQGIGGKVSKNCVLTGRLQLISVHVTTKQLHDSQE